MKSQSLTIILPCFNPDANWHINVKQQLQEILPQINFEPIEILIINDGSKLTIDNEFNYLKASFPVCQLISYTTNKGKGYAIREGVKNATGDIIIYTDIDFPYTVQSFLTIVHQLENHDLIIGTRDDTYFHNIPKTRAFISRGLKFLIKKTFKLPTSDTQGGLKGFRISLKPVFLKTSINRYLFDLEFIYLVAKQKFNIGIYTIELRQETVVRKTNLKIIFKEFLNLIQLLIRSKFGYS
jgi:glycosyltransferase involved in cell wall biosynthesis